MVASGQGERGGPRAQTLRHVSATDTVVLAAVELPPARMIRYQVCRPIQPVSASRDLAILELGEGYKINFGRGFCTIPPAEMVDGRGFASIIPTIAAPRISPEGEVWVQRRVIGPNAVGLIDVFDASGEYLGTLPPARECRWSCRRKGRAALVHKDEADVERIEVVALRRK